MFCFIERTSSHELVLVGAQEAACELKVSRSVTPDGKKGTRMSGSEYPFDKLHDDRLHSTLNVVVMMGCGRPVVWVVFDLGFRLGSHGKCLDIEAGSLLNNKTEYRYSMCSVNGRISQWQSRQRLGNTGLFVPHSLIDSISDHRGFTQTDKMRASLGRQIFLQSSERMMRNVTHPYPIKASRSVLPVFLFCRMQGFCSPWPRGQPKPCTLALGYA